MNDYENCYGSLIEICLMQMSNAKIKVGTDANSLAMIASWQF